MLVHIIARVSVMKNIYEEIEFYKVQREAISLTHKI